jgi:pantetheine-phosphate adenylyltransferase
MKAIYPGSFDPITLGHIDIIKRALAICGDGQLVIAVANNAKKKHWLTISERVELIHKVIQNDSRISVVPVTGLLANYCHDNDIHMIIRGLRTSTDFDYEFQIHQVNSRLRPVETIFLPAITNHIHFSSSIVRELHSHGAPISDYVHPTTEAYLKNRAEECLTIS